MGTTSVEQILLARAQPYVLTARSEAVYAREAHKGCSPVIVPRPVALEPAFRPVMHSPSQPCDYPAVEWRAEAPLPDSELIRVRLWIATDQRCDWNRSELLLKNVSQASCRLVMNIMGNSRQIVQQVVCHANDYPLFRTAFAGQFERSAISLDTACDMLVGMPSSSWQRVEFFDFCPWPPYSDLSTRPLELKRTPYAPLFAVFPEIEPPALGVYQVVFQPVSPEHDWGANIRFLTDRRYDMGRFGGFTALDRYPQDMPSNDRRIMAMDVESKAHNDKALYVAALRIGVVGAEGAGQAEYLLRSLAVVTSSIQHGGRPLRAISGREYRQLLSPDEIRRMFTAGLTYRAAFPVNSEELTTLFHIPPPEEFEHLKALTCPLEVLPIPRKLLSGTPIGECIYAGQTIEVCIPDGLRHTHTHVIGGTNTGKSTLLRNMILDDIRHKRGLALLDPHGTLVRSVLDSISLEDAKNVIVFDPGDESWVPIWNPFFCGVRLGHGRVADDIVRAFKSFITGWGDRLEHLLKHAIFAILHLPGSNLRDVADLLRKKSAASEQIRRQLQGLITNDMSSTFWEEDFDGYKQADLSPPQHKLSKLLVSDTVGRMLSQDQSLFDLRDVMDTGKVLLVDLSNLGSEERDVMGSLLLSLLHLTALSREVGISHVPRLFNIYCDEAHRLLTDSVEDLVNETRKFNVSLTLAHQQMAQLDPRKSAALASVGTTVIFRVIQSDAQYLARMLQEKIEPSVLQNLADGDAVARIGNHVVRIRPYWRPPVAGASCREAIIARSRELYYRPASEVDRDVRARRNKWAQAGQQLLADPPYASIGDPGGSAPKEAGKPDDHCGHGEEYEYETL